MNRTLQRRLPRADDALIDAALRCRDPGKTGDMIDRAIELARRERESAARLAG